MEKPYTLIKFEDLTAKLYKKNMSEYHYLSPRYGYKIGYRFNQLIYVYIDEQEGFVDHHLFKNATRKEIIDYLKEFKNSRTYLKNKV